MTAEDDFRLAAELFAAAGLKGCAALSTAYAGKVGAVPIRFEEFNDLTLKVAEEGDRYSENLIQLLTVSMGANPAGPTEQDIPVDHVRVFQERARSIGAIETHVQEMRIHRSTIALALRECAENTTAETALLLYKLMIECQIFEDLVETWLRAWLENEIVRYAKPMLLAVEAVRTRRPEHSRTVEDLRRAIGSGEASVEPDTKAYRNAIAHANAIILPDKVEFRPRINKSNERMPRALPRPQLTTHILEIGRHFDIVAAVALSTRGWALSSTYRDGRQTL